MSLISVLKEETLRLCTYLKLPSFDLIIISGVFSMIACNALVFSTLYFQTAGLSDTQAGIISSIGMLTLGIGSLLGGLIADALTKRCSRYHGRPFAAQVSMVCAMLFNALIYVGVRPSADSFWTYLALVVLLGLTAPWTAAGTTTPILSEIVEPEGRSTIMAWDSALEGASGAVLGNLGVSLFASLLGFKFSDASHTVGGNAELATALGKSIALTAVLPWSFTLVCYSLLHWSYPRDSKKIQQYRMEKCMSNPNPCEMLPEGNPTMEMDNNPVFGLEV
jgi:hypothetical protein